MLRALPHTGSREMQRRSRSKPAPRRSRLSYDDHFAAARYQERPPWEIFVHFRSRSSYWRSTTEIVQINFQGQDRGKQIVPTNSDVAGQDTVHFSFDSNVQIANHLSEVRDQRFQLRWVLRDRGGRRS